MQKGHRIRKKNRKQREQHQNRTEQEREVTQNYRTDDKNEANSRGEDASFSAGRKGTGDAKEKKIQKRNDGYSKGKLARKQKKLGNNFPNGAAILGGRSLEKGVHPGRILHNPSLEKRQRESCGTQDAKIINGLEGSACRHLASAVYPVDKLLSRKVKRTKNAGKRTAHYVIPDDSNPAGKSDTRANIVGQAEDGVAKSIGNHADEDGDQRAEAEEQQIGQAALI
ncbi:hypothetical protein C8F01DRAFT_1085363 [Mycena amicta]|nr:hypothetical protein C8F01DRAFT_1085363 [Mycena amicta]